LADNRARRAAPGRRRRPSRAPEGVTASGSAARRLAIDALLRIERGGAYANLVLPEMLARSDLAPADRHFVTELVYGTTRMRRACDHLVDRFLLQEVEPQVRAALRLGAYQLAFLQTPPHAAVDATVGAVRGRGRSVVNAVLRRVASAPVSWPDVATELSYPDWIVDRLTADLGRDRALAVLEAMNHGSPATVRTDGYVQDRASQEVVAAVGAEPGDVIVDLCAAPGGKATGLSAAGATVIATDLRPKRAGLVRANAQRLDLAVPVVIGDGAHPPFAPSSADRVLVDAPCSGLGSLRSRADARWRIDPDAPDRLARLQIELVRAGLELTKPGGTVVYSVCTLTRAEGTGVLEAVLGDGPATVIDGPGPPWDTVDGVATLFPTGGVSDAMTMFRLRRT